MRKILDKKWVYQLGGKDTKRMMRTKVEINGGIRCSV